MFIAPFVAAAEPLLVDCGRATDGETWTLTGRAKLALKAEVSISIASSLHTKYTLTTSVLDHVKPVRAGAGRASGR